MISAMSASTAPAPTAVSFLPSATEIVYTLGLDDHLLGRTFECDYPAAAAEKDVVLDSTIPADLSPVEIDTFVKSAGGSHGLYSIRDDLGDLAPDVIFTQDICGVCAVPADDVQGALDTLGCQSNVVSLDPHTLGDVITAVEDIAGALGAPHLAEPVASDLRQRLDSVRQAVAVRSRPRVLVLEWIDPPFGTGHWIPEMIETAGGIPVLANDAVPSEEVSWQQVADSEADVLITSPCGYYLDEAGGQAREVAARPEIAELPAIRNGEVYVVDGTSVVTRPGPRVVDGVEAFASVLHPDVMPPRPELIRNVWS